MSEQDRGPAQAAQSPATSGDIADLARANEALRRDRALLEAIHHAQTQFIIAEDPLGIFGEFLKSLISLTNSEYGFIDEMFYDADGKPLLTARAITDISWSDESRKMYQQFVSGTLNFTNLHSLYGVVMSSGKPVIANDAPHDPRRTGIPPGHPPLNTFLGLPLISNSKEFVGVIGLANRPGGYTEEVIAYLEPMVAACANLIAARKNDQRRRQAEQDLRRARDELELRVQERTAALREIEERLNLALKSAEVGTWSWNIVENSIIWDDYLHPLFGLKPGTFPGRYEAFLQTLDPEDRQRIECEVARAVEEDAAYDTEYQVVWPDGSVHWLGSRGKVYRDGEGRPLRMTGVCWDITERKRTQEALAGQTKALARSNAELEQFAYIASHDLQEPLRKVQSFGDLLVTTAGAALDETGRLYVERMQDAARRMRRLIDDLLTFSRVTSQAKTVVEVDLARVAREVVSDLAARLKTTGGRVEICHLPRLESDPTLARQLLQNLIGNALKYHREGVPPVVVLRSRILNNGEGACEIAVEDNGIGFEEKYLDRIFAPFQRLHGHGKYEGTGMGLAICRKIVERHGGTITARSTPGQGTTFIVTLPLRQPKGEPRHA